MSSTVLTHRPRVAGHVFAYIRTMLAVAVPPILVGIIAMVVYNRLNPLPAVVDVRDTAALNAFNTKLVFGKLIAFVLTGFALALTVGFRQWHVRRSQQGMARTIVLPEPLTADEVINRFMTPEDFHSDEGTGSHG